MVRATILMRNRVYKWLVLQKEPLNKTEIGKATNTSNQIDEILRDLVKIGWVKLICWRPDMEEYLVE